MNASRRGCICSIHSPVTTSAADLLLDSSEAPIVDLYVSRSRTVEKVSSIAYIDVHSYLVGFNETPIYWIGEVGGLLIKSYDFYPMPEDHVWQHDLLDQEELFQDDYDYA